MIKTLVLALISACMFASLGAAEHPGDKNSDHASIVALENDWLAHARDAATLDRILADDFVHPVPQGVFLTKKRHIDWAAHHPLPPGRSASFEKLDVRIYGDTAIANGTVVSKDAGDAKSHRTVFTDVFVRRQGRWQAVNAQENDVPAGQ